jgi:putative peptide zinc metalloprotease protein
MIQDPVTNRFFRIGWLDFELLVHWADNDLPPWCAPSTSRRR